MKNNWKVGKMRAEILAVVEAPLIHLHCSDSLSPRGFYLHEILFHLVFFHRKPQQQLQNPLSPVLSPVSLRSNFHSLNSTQIFFFHLFLNYFSNFES